VKSAALQERVILLLFKTAGSPEALFVTSTRVTGGRLALGLGLSAFQNDDIAWHNLRKIRNRDAEAMKNGLIVKGKPRKVPKL
jgi:hypothetical protein